MVAPINEIFAEVKIRFSIGQQRGGKIGRMDRHIPECLQGQLVGPTLTRTAVQTIPRELPNTAQFTSTSLS